MKPRARPSQPFDPGLQAERTALAWERTAIAVMVSGVILARYAAAAAPVGLAAIGILQTTFGGALLLWAGWHYEDLHGPLNDGGGVVHPFAARLVGTATVVFTFVCLAIAVGIVLSD